MKNLILAICLSTVPLLTAGGTEIPYKTTSDYPPGENVFEKDGIFYSYSYLYRGPFANVVGLPEEDDVVIPEFVEYPYFSYDNEWHLGKFYIDKLTPGENITVLKSPVSINYLTLPENLVVEWDRFTSSAQKIVNVKEFYIPSFEWAIYNNFDFSMEYTYADDTDSSPSVWIGKRGEPDAYQLTEVQLPAYLDGKAYSLSGAGGIESVDLSDLYDPGQIVISDLKDLKEVLLNPYLRSLPAMKGCNGFPGFVPANSVAELYGDNPLADEVTPDKLPVALTKMGSGIYAGKDFTDFTMPDNLEEIGTISFGNRLERVTVGPRVRKLDGVFTRCEYLKNVTIGSRVTSIAPGEFKNCTLLTSVEVLAQNPPTIDGDAFDAVTYLLCTLYVPVGTKDRYAQANGWRKFANIEEKAFPAQSPIDRLKHTSLYTNTGETAAIEVEFDGGAVPSLTYEVADASIISVDENGRVTGLKEGQTVVNVIPDGEAGLAVRCVVSVIPKLIPVEKIKAEPMQLDCGDAFVPIEYTIYPEDASIKDIEWKSSNETVARVTCDGKVIAGKNGSAIIYGTARDGSGKKCEMRVEVANVSGIESVTGDTPAEPTPVYNLQGVRINNTEHGIYIIDGKKVLK